VGCSTDSIPGKSWPLTALLCVVSFHADVGIKPPLGSQKSAVEDDEVQPLHLNVPLLSDSDMDPDWVGHWEDFQFEGTGVLPSSLDGSFTEDPIAELGLYNPDEDLSGWSSTSGGTTANGRSRNSPWGEGLDASVGLYLVQDSAGMDWANLALTIFSVFGPQVCWSGLSLKLTGEFTNSAVYPFFFPKRLLIPGSPWLWLGYEVLFPSWTRPSCIGIVLSLGWNCNCTECAWIGMLHRPPFGFRSSRMVGQIGLPLPLRNFSTGLGF
jgi:hypothetical protein